MISELSDFEKALRSGQIKTLTKLPPGNFIPSNPYQQLTKTEVINTPEGASPSNSSGDGIMGLFGGGGLGGLGGLIGAGAGTLLGGPVGGAIGGAALGGLLGGQTPQMPQQPDWEAIARAEAEGNLNLAQYQTAANRPTEITPFGTRTWTQDPNNPASWTSEVALSPEQQALFGTTQQTQQQLANLGLTGSQQLGDLFGQRYQTPGETPTYAGNQAAMPGYGEHRQQVVDAMMSRVNQDVERDRDAKRSQLIAQGIPPGSEAYQREMQQLDRQLTDARQQAEVAAENLASTGYSSALAGRSLTNQELMDKYKTGMTTQQQQIANALTERQVPLSELSTVLGQTNIQNPQFGQAGQMPYVPGPDLTGAAQQGWQGQVNMYNAQQAQQNALRSGLLGLGAGALAGFSDIRLKHNLKRLSEYKGIPIYEFSYLGSRLRHIGMMAQDVLKVFPKAVFKVNGYLAVNYGALCDAI